MFTILLLCLVGIAVAQQPVPCTTPPQWEGRIINNHEKGGTIAEGKISYDSVYHRQLIATTITVGDLEINVEILSLYEAKIEFVYDLKYNNCTRSAITQPWRDFGILPNASSYGTAYIGSSAVLGGGLLVTIWGGNTTLPTNETVPYIGTWTYQGCLPVSQTTFRQTYGDEIISFYDIVVGISNPNVFIPKPECLTEQEYAMRDTLFGTPIKKN